MAKTRSRTRAGQRNDEVKELFPTDGQVASGDEFQGPESETVTEVEESGTGTSSWVAFAPTFFLIVCVILSATFCKWIMS